MDSLREESGLSAAPVPQAPVGTVDAVRALTWSAVPGATRYRATLFDARGQVVWEAESPDTALTVPDSVRLATGGTYAWTVSARTGEVRRSFAGDYAPLYQVAYKMGGLQFRALHRDLVQSGQMTNRAFHDAISSGRPHAGGDGAGPAHRRAADAGLHAALAVRGGAGPAVSAPHLSDRPT